MSRSGYVDFDGWDGDNWSHICWRGAVASGIRGKRGQAALKEIAEALDALPEQSLAAGTLQTEEGSFCTLGALGKARGMDMSHIDPEDRESVAHAFGISEALAAEIMYLNDEDANDYKWAWIEICGPMQPGFYHKKMIQVFYPHAGFKRWQSMRNWVKANIAKPKETT